MRPALRLLLLASMLVLIAGAAFAAWRFAMGRTTTLRVAVTSLDSPEARLTGALNRWMAGRNGRYRLRPIVVSSAQDGLDAVVRRDADLAFARADASWPGGVASGVVMFRTKLVLLATERGGVTTLAQLQNKTIGLLGGLAVDDPLLTTLLRLHSVGQTRFVPLSDAEIVPALARNAVQVLAFAAPLVAGGPGQERLEKLLRAPSARKMQLLGLPDGESTSAQDRRYDSHDLAPGQLRTQPPLPEETESVMAVAHHLVMRRATPSIFVSRFIAELIDARRGVLATAPLAGQIDAPDEEVNAAAPVHPGASAFFNDEQVTLAELISEWGYLALVVLGALGSGLVWLTHWLWPDRRKSEGGELIAAFLALRREARSAGSETDLRDRHEALMQRVENAITEGRLAEEDTPPVIAAAQMTERAIAAT